MGIDLTATIILTNRIKRGGGARLPQDRFFACLDASAFRDSQKQPLPKSTMLGGWYAYQTPQHFIAAACSTAS
jgi:hypothetical protein